MEKPTAERVREVLHYDPDSGSFTWKAYINNRIKVGGRAGTGSNGYVNISIDGEIIGAHRLAWLYMTGEWPSHQIDHIDGNRGNNAFSNLREATASQNRCNRGPQKNNPSGFKGVSWFKKTRKWRARIGINGKHRTIGYFDTPEQAHEAYAHASKKLHGEFANHGI